MALPSHSVARTGTEIQTSIRELEMINRRPPVPFIPALLPSPLTKSDVPIGTEVWYYPTPEDTYAPRTNRLTRRCSELAPLSRWLLPASAFPPPRNQRASSASR